MNNISLNAHFVVSKCKRFINQHLPYSRAKDSIQPIQGKTRSTQGARNQGSEQDLYLYIVKTYWTVWVHSRARALQVLRASLKGVACLVAVVIGTALFMPIAHAPAAQRMPYKSVKLYAKELTPNKTEYSCLKKLWGKESAWNHLADNPKSTAFGIPQILGLKTKDPYKQIDLGLKYIDHRYHGDACKAWDHWLRKGWY
jgi:hypothetical protein